SNTSKKHVIVDFRTNQSLELDPFEWLFDRMHFMGGADGGAYLVALGVYGGLRIFETKSGHEIAKGHTVVFRNENGGTTKGVRTAAIADDATHVAFANSNALETCTLPSLGDCEQVSLAEKITNVAIARDGSVTYAIDTRGDLYLVRGKKVLASSRGGG